MRSVGEQKLVGNDLERKDDQRLEQQHADDHRLGISPNAYERGLIRARLGRKKVLKKCPGHHSILNFALRGQISASGRSNCRNSTGAPL